MPTYDLHCDGCGGDWTVVQSIHDPLDTDHVVTPPGNRDQAKLCPGPVVQVFSPPTIHGAGPSGLQRAAEQSDSKDIAAYRRLRKDGVQPKSVRGSAEVESRATEKFEVERAMKVENPHLRRRMVEAHSMLPHGAA